MSYKKVSFEEAKNLIDTVPDLMILDVREEEEYITGHAKDAVLFTLADINDVTAEDLIPSKETPLLVYCRSGRRSLQAAFMLESYGYENVYDVGGLIGWPYGLE